MTPEKNNLSSGSKTGFRNFRDDVSILPLKRCSKKGVADFISKDASSYSCKNIGTIHDSIAKKAVDAHLGKEREELHQKTIDVFFKRNNSTSLSLNPESDISKETLQELLVSCLNNWVFQISNGGELVTFYAKNQNETTELFLNFDMRGDTSYILFGNHCGNVSSEILEFLKNKLHKVYTKITADYNDTELLWKRIDSGSVTHKCERIKFEDPDNFNNLKKEALQEFILEEESLLEKILNFFDFKNIGHPLVFSEQITDATLINYYLENIKIDIRQIYA